MSEPFKVRKGYREMTREELVGLAELFELYVAMDREATIAWAALVKAALERK